MYITEDESLQLKITMADHFQQMLEFMVFKHEFQTIYYAW